MKKIIYLVIFLSLVFLGGCSPEIGSKEWCEAMDEKPKSEWSSREASEYAKNCVFRTDD